jgi:hypothetical protein
LPIRAGVGKHFLHFFGEMAKVFPGVASDQGQR